MGRFIGFRYEQGVVVLDTYSGEVVLVPPNGGQISTLRSAIDVGSPVRLEIISAGMPAMALLATPTFPPASSTPSIQRSNVPSSGALEPPPPLAEDLAPLESPAKPAEDFEIDAEPPDEAPESAPVTASPSAAEPGERPTLPPQGAATATVQSQRSSLPPEVAASLPSEPPSPAPEPSDAHARLPEPADEIPEVEVEEADVVEEPSEPPKSKPTVDFEESTAEIDPKLVASLRAASIPPPPPAPPPEEPAEPLLLTEEAEEPQKALPPEIAAFDALFDQPPDEPIAVGDEAEVDLDVDDDVAPAARPKEPVAVDEDIDVEEEATSSKPRAAAESAPASAKPSSGKPSSDKPSSDRQTPSEATDERADTEEEVATRVAATAAPAAEPMLGDDEVSGEIEVEEPPPEPAPLAVEAPPVEVPHEPKPKRYPNADRVLETYPYPIARAFEELQKVAEPDARARWVVETASATIEIWSVVAASEYFRSNSSVAEIDSIVIEDLVRPSYSTWSRLLSRSIRAMEAAGLRPFNADVVTAYNSLEAKEGETAIDRLVRFSTDRAGGLAPEGFEARIDAAEGDLEALLSATEWLSRVAIYHALESSPTEALEGHRFSGPHPAATSEPLSRVDFDMAAGEWFLRDEQSLETMPLLPFFAEQTVGRQRELFVLAGYNRKSIVHRSVYGKTLDRPSRLRQVVSKKVPLAKGLEPREVSFEKLASAGESITKRTLDRLTKTRVVVPELLVERRALASRLTELDRPEFRALFVSGQPGVGKSSSMYAYASERLAAGDAVFFYRGRNLSDPDMGARFLKDLGAKSLFFDELLKAAHPHFERAGSRRFLRIIIDGVDEHPTDPNGLVSALDTMVRQAVRYPWFKLVATARSGFLERLPARTRPAPSLEARYLTAENEAGDELTFHLRPLSGDERSKLFEKLDGSLGLGSLDPTRSRAVAVPLYLRLAKEHGSVGTRQELISSWISKRLSVEAKDESTGKKRGDLLRAFVRELDALRAHAIPHERLYEVDSLRAAVVNGQIDSPYGQLLDLGLLVEERDDDRCFVSLCHAAFLEHLLVEHHEPQVHSGEDLRELAVRALRFPSLEASVSEIIVRSARAGRWSLALEALEECVPGADGQLRPEHELLVRVVRDALIELLAGHDASGTDLLAALSKGRHSSHVFGMSEALDEAVRLGEEPIVEAVAKALLASTEGIDDQARRAHAEMRLAKLAVSKSDLEAAEVLYERAGAHAGKAGDRRERLRADLGRGKIAALRGKADEAASLFESSFTGLVEVGDSFHASEAKQNHAVLVGQKGDREASERLAEEAKKLAHDSGNARVEVRALNMLAIAADRRQEGALAEKLFVEALETATSRGLTELAATTHGSLGVLYHSRGDAARAEVHLVRELELRREIGDKLPLARSLKRLAVLFAHRGDDEREEQYLVESLTLLADIEDRAGVAETLGTLAALYEKRGDLERVLELHRRALAQQEEIDSKPEIAATLVKIANVLAEREDYDGALESFTRALSIREAGADRPGVADCLMGLGRVHEARGDLDSAEIHYERSLAIREELEDQDGISDCISSVGGVMERRGDLAGAEEHYRRALEIDLGSDDPLGAAFMFMLLGGVLYQQGQLHDAEEHAKRSVTRFEELEHHVGLANALSTLGVCKHMGGHLDEAVECFTRELALRAEQNDEDRAAYSTWLLASAELDRNNVERAAELRPKIAGALEHQQNPKTSAVLAVLDLRLALKQAAEAEITSGLEAAEAAFADAPGLLPLEDGLGTAYLEAALHYDKRKQITRSKDLAMKAHEVVAGRPYHRQAELTAILPKLRRAPARPVRPVRPIKKPK
ncbi:MAG: tetratricopeptide repeat protein [Deltaproteobacteria bacterium]|nr:tetratricopeptide repeat protein [Deltaproteobacteria bacterium]